jgi:hypothetical protein
VGRATRQLERKNDAELHYDAAFRFAHAVHREEGARGAWQDGLRSIAAYLACRAADHEEGVVTSSLPRRRVRSRRPYTGLVALGSARSEQARC